jgi:hypothetical protein
MSFLVIGLAGAAWRLARQDRAEEEAVEDAGDREATGTVHEAEAAGLVN